MKKYLIRVVGALCILAVAALMFVPSWFQIEGIRARELKDVRSDVSGVISEISGYFLDNLDDDDFVDELEDNDLPYKKRTIKSRFKEWEKLTKELLDTEVSLMEVTNLAAKTPGVVEDVQNIMELPEDMVSTIFYRSAYYMIRWGEDASGDVGEEVYFEESQKLQETVAEAVEDTDGLNLVCYGVVALICLVMALAVLSAVTHVTNKGRWVKYLFLALLLVLVVGSIVVLPIVNETLADTMGDSALLRVMEDAELKMTVYPYLAVVLMFVPIVLDIVFERKNKLNGG